jgi:glycosyltransferase involved in cell wall biosynthesis
MTVSFERYRGAMARILAIRHMYFPLDIRVRREVEALRSAGHEVDVICLARSGERLCERWNGARIVRLPLDFRAGRALTYLLEYTVFAMAAGLLAAALHLRRRYQLVQVHSVPDPLVFAALVPRLLGARVLLDLHETMPEFFASRFGKSTEARVVRLVAAAEQASIRFATHVITCTEEMKEAFVARGAAPGKIDVVLNSADESIFDVERYPPQPRQDGRFVLMVHGSVEERYGIDTTIEALALLADELPRLELHVYGGGSYLPDLERLAEDLGVGDRIRFPREWLPIDQVVEALSRADAGVVAMKRDAFRDLTHCNKMYELITMRRPAIVSRTQSVEAYFDEDCFAWFESNDPQDLARAIRALHSDPDWARALVDRAATRNEPYRWIHQRDRYLDVVRRVLESTGPRSAV